MVTHATPNRHTLFLSILASDSKLFPMTGAAAAAEIFDDDLIFRLLSPPPRPPLSDVDLVTVKCYTPIFFSLSVASNEKWWKGHLERRRNKRVAREFGTRDGRNITVSRRPYCFIKSFENR